VSQFILCSGNCNMRVRLIVANLFPHSIYQQVLKNIVVFIFVQQDDLASDDVMILDTGHEV